MKKFILVNNRHTHSDLNGLPALFNDVQSTQIFDFDLHKKILHKVLNNVNSIKLYITGLTPLLISTINYCRLFGVTVILMHYNTETNSYVPQSII